VTNLSNIHFLKALFMGDELGLSKYKTMMVEKPCQRHVGRTMRWGRRLDITTYPGGLFSKRKTCEASSGKPWCH
jgi:hypothetical protein